MFATNRDGAYREILCVQEQRIVANDNTVSWNGCHLQISESPFRRHFMVEARLAWSGARPRGLRHERTCRPPQVLDSFLSRLIVPLISPGFRPLARPTGARHSYAAGSHCI
jgi:hypothetical protein